MIPLLLSKRRSQIRVTRRTLRIRTKTRIRRLRTRTLRRSSVISPIDRIEVEDSQISKKTPNNSKERRSTGRRVKEMVLMALTAWLLPRPRARDQPLHATETSAGAQLPRMEVKLRSTRVELVGEPEVLADEIKTKMATMRSKMGM